MATKRRDSYAESKGSAVLSSLGQHLVALSHINKAELLSEATKLTHSDESRAQAAAILSRLKQLNPGIASQFHPKEDALTSLYLRMIRPSTSAQSPDDDRPPISSFLAVSYCWHYAQWPIAPAATPIAPGWEVSQPMMDAVMALRQSPDEGVWLDKLCINQDNESDKMAHIGAMDAIYRSARRTVILLEDIQLEKDEQEAGLVYAGFYADLCREAQDGALEGVEKARFVNEYFPRREEKYRTDNRDCDLAAATPFVFKILGARWFSRAWCAHESRMTRHRKVDNPLFLCFASSGKVLSFEFRFIHYLARYLADLEPPVSLVGQELAMAINDPDPKTLRQRGWRMQRLMPDSNPENSALQHLVSVLSSGCFKKGDLMSIALNTGGIPLYFGGGDIRCVEDVIWMYSLLVLAAGDLVPLVAVGPKLRISDAGGEIISWATNPHRATLDDKLPNPLPGSITAITREYIELDLLIFESAPKPASPDSQAKATRLITEHNLYSLAEVAFSTLDDTTQSLIRTLISEAACIIPSARPLETLIHRLLSLALENGLPWTLAFPSALHDTTSSQAWLYGPIPSPANPLLAPAARSLLTLLNHPSADPDPSLLQSATVSLTTLLDPRLLLLPSNPRNIPLPAHLGTALLTSAPSNRSYIALPAVLAHLPASYDRAWVVEPFDIAAKPETAEDWLPPADLRIVKDGEEGEEKIEEVLPVLTSDYADRRAPISKREEGTWRLRKKQVLFGGLERWGEVLGGLETQGVMLLKRQRVYGAEDYPWKEIHKAMRKVLGEAAAIGGED